MPTKAFSIAMLALLIVVMAMLNIDVITAALSEPGGIVQLIPLPNATALASVPCISESQAPGGAYTQANISAPGGPGFIITPDVWNTRSGAGEVTVTACRDLVRAQVENVNVTASNVYDTVLGYPEVIYGYKPWGQLMTAESPLLRLPQRIGELPTIIAYLNYTLNYTNGRGDFSFDIWITKQYMPSSVTQGDLEVMVWFYHSPGFTPMGYREPNFTVSVPTIINGSLVNATWEVYVAKSIPWTYMAFVLTPPMSSGYIMVPLNSVFSVAASEWSRLFNYSLYDMYLNDVELGMEYSSVAWPPVNVNVSAWYKVTSYGFVVLPRGYQGVGETTTETVTVTLPTTSTVSVPPETVVETTAVTRTVTSVALPVTITRTALSPTGYAAVVGLSAAVAVLAVLLAVLALRAHRGA